MIKHLLMVGLGGAAGSIVRFMVQRISNTPAFPFGTLAVNIAGCFMIGLLWGLLNQKIVGQGQSLLLMTGFCGGFTTFSAFTYESIQMLYTNKWLIFVLYTSLSVTGGLLATYLGYKLLI